MSDERECWIRAYQGYHNVTLAEATHLYERRHPAPPPSAEAWQDYADSYVGRGKYADHRQPWFWVPIGGVALLLIGIAGLTRCRP